MQDNAKNCHKKVLKQKNAMYMNTINGIMCKMLPNFQLINKRGPEGEKEKVAYYLTREVDLDFIFFNSLHVKFLKLRCYFLL